MLNQGEILLSHRWESLGVSVGAEDSQGLVEGETKSFWSHCIRRKAEGPDKTCWDLLALRCSAKSGTVKRHSSGFPPWSCLFLYSGNLTKCFLSVILEGKKHSSQSTPYACMATLKPGPWTVISSFCQVSALPILEGAHTVHLVPAGAHRQSW